VPYAANPIREGRPRLSWRRGGEPHWNPVLFHDQERSRVLLYFKVGWTIKKWETFVTESTDDGRTWSEPVELVPGDHGGRGPVKNKLIVLADGDSLAHANGKGGGYGCLLRLNYTRSRYPPWLSPPDPCVAH
jgi:predicted neuraminidase